MSPRRHGFGGWLSRRPTWQQIAFFIGVASAAGTAVTSFERTYGVAANNFGFARQVSVTREIKDLRADVKQDNAKILAVAERTQLWQLYDQIKRTQRNIDNLKAKKTLDAIEREQLQDFGNQLAEATKDYQRLVDKIKGGS